MSTSRKCSVPTCGVYVPKRDLMCRTHWKDVPYAFRVKVQKAQAAFDSNELTRAELEAVEARATATVAAPPAPPGAPPANTTYSGCRITMGGRVIATAVTTCGGEFRPDASRAVRDHSEEFEWGYPGSGPSQLALALVLDATGDESTALACYQWYKWASVAMWGARWITTAGEIRKWVEQWRRETPEAAVDVVDQPAIVEGGGA